MEAAAGEEPPFLQVSDLSVEFPTTDGFVRAVGGFSFAVRRGTTLGIVGESGSGKTVASLAIMGLNDRRSTRTRGSIQIGGDDVVSMSEEEIRLLRGRRMAIIFQDPLTALHPYYKIGRQIAEAYQVHNAVSPAAARARAIELVARVSGSHDRPSKSRATLTSSPGACASAPRSRWRFRVIRTS